MGQDSDFRDGLVAILPQLRRFARTLTRNPNDADDLLQAACERFEFLCASIFFFNNKFSANLIIAER